MSSARFTPRGIALFCLSAVLLLMFILATGCGKGTPLPDELEQVREETGEILDQDLFPIRCRLKWLHQAQFAGIYMAREKGFYRDRGLDVEILPGGVDYPPYRSLVTGEADVSILNLMFAIHHYHSGPPLVNLAQITQKNTTLLVGKKSSGIESIGDLRGKKVGVWRDEPGEYIRHFLESLDLDIEIIPIDWSVNLLLNDAIDLMNVMRYNEYHRLMMAGLDEDELAVIDLSDYRFDLIDDGLYTTLDFYTRHKAECDALAEATLEGWIYAFSHREETLDVILRYLRESYLPANRAHQAWMLDIMYDSIRHYPDAIGCLHETDFNRDQNIILELDSLHPPVDYDTFYPHEIRKESRDPRH